MAKVTLPESLTGEFRFGGHTMELTGGEQVIHLAAPAEQAESSCGGCSR